MVYYETAKKGVYESHDGNGNVATKGLMSRTPKVSNKCDICAAHNGKCWVEYRRIYNGF